MDREHWSKKDGRGSMTRRKPSVSFLVQLRIVWARPRAPTAQYYADVTRKTCSMNPCFKGSTTCSPCPAIAANCAPLGNPNQNLGWCTLQEDVDVRFFRHILPAKYASITLMMMPTIC